MPDDDAPKPNAQKAFRLAYEQNLRTALESALANSDPNVHASFFIRGALASLVYDWADAIAVEMAGVAIEALVAKSPDARQPVGEWHAQRHGCSDPNSDALVILDVASAVERTAYLYPVDPPSMPEVGARVVADLRTFLVGQLGPGVPAADDLENWIRRHSHKGARGKLTTAGIVAKIVHRGRLLGARGEDEQKTLRRVTMVMTRHHFTPLVK